MFIVHEMDRLDLEFALLVGDDGDGHDDNDDDEYDEDEDETHSL